MSTFGGSFITDLAQYSYPSSRHPPSLNLDAFMIVDIVPESGQPSTRDSRSGHYCTGAVVRLTSSLFSLPWAWLGLAWPGRGSHPDLRLLPRISMNPGDETPAMGEQFARHQTPESRISRLSGTPGCHLLAWMLFGWHQAPLRRGLSINIPNLAVSSMDRLLTQRTGVVGNRRPRTSSGPPHIPCY